MDKVIKNLTGIFIFKMFIFCSLFIMFEQITYSTDGEIAENFIVYGDKNEILFEKSYIEQGDIFVTKDFYEYQIYRIEENKAYAKRLRRLYIPKIKREYLPIQRAKSEPKICLYMTHNDESYKPTDGYDSIYGAGGIHDVAKRFKKELENKNINIVLDETLHIPHDNNAYNRSKITANRLLKEESPDAMFDIHRDGVSKSFYATSYKGEALSKIRIVVGKSNPYFDKNYEFAQTLFAVGNSMYPWLFSDIYCGKGHYNQSCQTTDLLFEMGTYLIEKESVYNSLPYLADVVDTVLYASRTEENGDIIVDESVPETNENPVIENQDIKRGSGWIKIVIWIFVGVTGLVIVGAYSYKTYREQKIKKS